LNLEPIKHFVMFKKKVYYLQNLKVLIMMQMRLLKIIQIPQLTIIIENILLSIINLLLK